MSSRVIDFLHKKSTGRCVFLIALLVVAWFYLRLNNGIWAISPDSTTYVEGARSLAKFEGYAAWNGTPVTFFPPGTSLAYALAALVPHNDYFFFNLLTKFLLLGYLIFTYLILEKRHPWVFALFGFLILSLSNLCISESTRILSDI